MNLSAVCFDVPCGRLLIGAYRSQLCLCDWVTNLSDRNFVQNRISRLLGASRFCICGNVEQIDNEDDRRVVIETIRQLNEYFQGNRIIFELPIILCGSAFQLDVWRELQKIPIGSMMSYSELATRIARPRAVRAVAAACRANALSIILPCHRIIGKDNKLTGYAGGLNAKKWLLQHEKNILFCHSVALKFS